MRTTLQAALALTTLAASLGAQKVPDLAPYLIADRAAEVALARTAAPSEVSGKASVMVFTRNGYVEAAKGTNGFTCLVMRSFASPPGDPQFWNPHTSAPHCFNQPAARTVLPAMLAQMQWALAGKSPAEVKASVAQAYASGRFVPPAAGAMAYMLSPRQHLSDSDPHWMPHLMFYYDKSLTGSTFGAGGGTAPIIDAAKDDPGSPIQTVYIPIRTWSDGSTAMHMTTGQAK